MSRAHIDSKSDRRLVDASTEERATYIALRHFGQLVDTIPVPVWILGLDGKVRYGNRAWMTAASGTGVAGDETVWTDACHPDDRSAAEEAFREAAAAAENFTIDVRLRQANGACRWWSFAGAPYYGPNGNLQSYVGTCSDITASRQAQRAIRRLAAKLIGAQETERRWIAGELHDDVMQRLGLLSAKLESLARIARPKLQELKSGISDASRLTKGVTTTLHVLSHQLHPAKLDLLGLVKTLDGLCREVSQDYNVRIAFAAHGKLPVLPPEMTVSLFRIAQEALQNAVKHSAAREISVHVSGDSMQIRLLVADDGKGFDPLLPRFGGLGLLTMRERVVMIGGDLRIESAPNKGATIEAIVPIGPASR
jgi:PAS domain S-box-containing protein